jgi:hypothetical protein
MRTRPLVTGVCELGRRARAGLAVQLRIVRRAMCRLLVVGVGVILAAWSPSMAHATCVWQQVTPALTTPITDVAAVSPTDAWLFAEFYDYQRWNGTAWIDWGASPIDVTASDGDSPTDVWVVNVNNQSAHFNGTTWTQIPFAGNKEIRARAVSVVSPTLAFEGGLATSGGSQIQRWNGTRWHVFTPPPGTIDIGSLSALSASDVWAIASLSGTSVLAHWDGSSWTTFHPQSSHYIGLAAVAARTSTDVWAVGGQGTGTPTAHTYHWDGNSWSEVPLPAPVPAVTELFDVSAERGSQTVATGARGRNGSETYIMRFDGGSWRRERVNL